MDLLARLQDDMKTAMKSGQKDRLLVIRMLISDVKNIDLHPQKPTAEEAVASYAKKLRKSAEEYQKLGKPEEVKKFHTELAIVEEYLPKKASAEETGALIDTFLAANKFAPDQAGRAMGSFMKAHGSGVDPAIVNRLMKQKLKRKKLT